MKFCWLLFVLTPLLKRCCAENNATVGLSALHVRYSAPSVAPVPSAAVRVGAPPPELPPHGVHIYDSLHHVPTRLLSTHANVAPRCAARQTSSPFRPYVCGSRCENVLLAMRAFCKDAERRWIPCAKARKFRRCLTRVCYRAAGGRRGVKAPSGFYDDRSVAIVRSRRPLPVYERRAIRNRQSSTQSAIFK